MPESYVTDRMVVTPHRFVVPLDWANPGGETIEVFAREVVAIEKRRDDLPYLCYFQGGPGHQGYSPSSRGSGGVFGKLLDRYRILMLDQRGTGLSTAVDGPAMAALPVDQQVAYLRHFRQDSIVKDAEFIRAKLIGDKPWSIYGQSFGGWCSLTYLSLFPENLTESFIFGGFAPVGHGPDEVYSALIERVKERNQQLIERFPDDDEHVRLIVDALTNSEQRLPGGERVTVRDFLQLGSQFGYHHSMSAYHFAIERAAADLKSMGRLSVHSSQAFHDPMSVTTNPIYGLLHEAIYSEGAPTNWSAKRILEANPEFSLTNERPYFVGEMVGPWMFEQYEALKPLQEAAHLLAASEWTPLYDKNRLAEQQVPVIGTVYYEDLYVDRGFALEVTKMLGKCSPWITNQYEHDGLSNDPDAIFTRLFELRDNMVLG